MNILLIYTLTALNSRGQEPTKTITVQEEQVNTGTPQEEEISKKNASSIQNKNATQDLEQNIEKTKDIEGLSPQDNDMIQLMLNTGKSISHEQRLLSDLNNNVNTELGTTSQSPNIGLVGNTSSDLFNFATVTVVLVLFLLGFVSYFFRRKTSDVPEMRMVARSMFGAEGSLAIIALEHNSKREPKYILLGLNNGAAPRLIMELPSYNESSESTPPEVRSLQKIEGSQSVKSESEDLRDVLSRANFLSKSPRKEPLRAVVDNDVSIDDEEFILRDQDIVAISPSYRNSQDGKNDEDDRMSSAGKNKSSDEEKWLRELQNAMDGNSEE